MAQWEWPRWHSESACLQELGALEPQPADGYRMAVCSCGKKWIWDWVDSVTLQWRRPDRDGC